MEDLNKYLQFCKQTIIDKGKNTMAIGRITGQMLSANLARSGTDLAFETTLLVLDVTNSRIGVGTASPATTFHINATDALRIPAGNSAQRPGSPANGDIRYNSTTTQIEGYNGAWNAMTGGSSLSDTDGNTGIAVERATDQNEIHFFTESSGDVGHIRDDGSFEINNLKIADMTISSLTTNGDINITPNGTGSTVIKRLSVTDGLDLGDLAALNVGAISVDEVKADNVTTGFDLTLQDNIAAAMEIKEGSNVYMNFATTDSSELITVSKAMTIASGVTFTTDTADITGGAIDGVTIGSSAAATALVVSGGVNIDDGGDGAMDGVVIGAASAAAGSFTAIVGTTATLTNAQVTNIKANDATAAMTIADSTGDVTVSTNFNVGGNATVTGNLTVNGATTTIESTSLTIEDPMITLAKNNSGGNANTFDQGLFFNRGSLDNVSAIWDESADEFAFAVTSAEDGATAGNITIDSYAGLHAGVTTVTDLETGVISAADGTESVTIADSTGVATIASSVLTTTDINGGSIDGAIIGAASAAAGTFTGITGSSLTLGEGNITNVGSIALDTITADGTDINISVSDNSATALTVKEGANVYLTFDSTNTAEVITSAQDFTVATTKTFTTDTADINGGAIDGTIVGANSAAAGTFTTATAVSVQATNIKANDATTSITIADSTGAVVLTKATKVTGAFEVDGSTFIFNESSADVDFRFEGNGNANLLFGDAGADRIGIHTATPAYTLDVGTATDAILLPTGNTAARPTAAAGVLRFNSQTGTYEGSQDGSTWVSLATAGDTPTFTKETATGDGSTTVFSGFFSSAPENANNVFVYIDNVYQEPTENYSVSSTNLTFTSAPHSAARIFAITGADNTALATGGVARSETSSTNFTSSATNILTFNGATYRSAEIFITLTDAGNTEYSAMKGTVVHDGTTAFITVYGITNTGASDLATITANYNGGTVEVKAQSTGGQTAAQVQYSLSV